MIFVVILWSSASTNTKTIINTNVHSAAYQKIGEFVTAKRSRLKKGSIERVA
jgi:hypothetical protein